MEKRAFFLSTPVGKVGIAENGRAVTNLFFSGTVAPASYQLEETALLRLAADQIHEYFSGKRRSFDLPLEPEGTPFQRFVWDALLTIPYGETRTYHQIAEQIGRPSACRAVGTANGRNPISILIPCHRVIGASGGLTGYAGGLAAKELLLRLECGSEKCTEIPV